MSDIAVRVENLSTRYCIGPRERYGALCDVITDVFAAPFRRLREIRHLQFEMSLRLPSAYCLLVFRHSPFAMFFLLPTAY